MIFIYWCERKEKNRRESGKCGGRECLFGYREREGKWMKGMENPSFGFRV